MRGRSERLCSATAQGHAVLSTTRLGAKRQPKCRMPAAWLATRCRTHDDAECRDFATPAGARLPRIPAKCSYRRALIALILSLAWTLLTRHPHGADRRARVSALGPPFYRFARRWNDNAIDFRDAERWRCFDDLMGPRRQDDCVYALPKRDFKRSKLLSRGARRRSE